MLDTNVDRTAKCLPSRVFWLADRN